WNQHHPELGTHRIALGKDPHHLVGSGASGYVVVGRLASEHDVTHASADQVSLVAGQVQSTHDLDGEIPHRISSWDRRGRLSQREHRLLRRSRQRRNSNNIEAVADTYILGIESSCDETAAAVVRSGEQVVSNVVFSQFATHGPYGGVVPELASREHLRAIVPVVRQALEDAHQTYQSVDALAVTQGPGLAGALLVGISYAKALAFAMEKPLIAVNHLEGHIHAVLLEERQKGNRELAFPVLALVVSGGHTHLYLANQRNQGWSYENVGHTRDDAAGEAFDKVAKLLGLGYPGGPVIDKLARFGDAGAVKFPLSQIKHPDRREKDAPQKGGPRNIDFSYSGIKTSVL